MNTIFSPARLEVLLHYYYSPAPHPHAEKTDTVSEFIEEGLLVKGSPFQSGYSLTDKGQFYVKMLLNTPYPEQVWIDPRYESQ